MENKKEEIKREDINIFQVQGKKFYLEIKNNAYDIFRAFNTKEELINHLKLYPIDENIIKELCLMDCKGVKNRNAKRQI